MARRRATVVSQAPGAIGHAGAGPGGERLGDRVLGRVLGGIEVTQVAGERGHEL